MVNYIATEGNYSTFLEAKALREEQELAQESKRQNLYRRELAWIRRGAKAVLRNKRRVFSVLMS